MRGFGSDNHSGVHPELLKAVQNANVDHVPSYGTDEISLKLEKKITQIFGPTAQAFCVFNGTAANVLCLRALVQPYQSVICSDVSHMHVDECGAPEYFSGAKLLTIASDDKGKITPPKLQASFIRKGDQHYSQAKVISLTLPTELATCYSYEELKELVNIARKENLYVHIDGARFANACVYLNKSFKELSVDLGIDALSFGGTKNGLMMGELVIFFNAALAENFKYIRKQSGQLPSKTRFVAAQFLRYFENNLWKDIASHSLGMAQALYDELKGIPELQIRCEPESNAVFVVIPQKWIKPLREKYFFYVWNEQTFECRLMTSWDTTLDDIRGFGAAVRALSKGSL